MNDATRTRPWIGRLARIAPGLPALLGYRRVDLSYDLIAGLSVAAVALPSVSPTRSWPGSARSSGCT